MREELDQDQQRVGHHPRIPWTRMRRTESPEMSLLRTQQRRASSDGEDTLVGSDLERTMVEKKAQQQETKKETKKKSR